MTTATKRKKITKKAFEEVLNSKYGGNVQARVHHEEQFDGNPAVRMTLYYELIEENNRKNDGSNLRHCGTWMSGEGWEFLPENGEVVIETDGDELRRNVEKMAKDAAAMESLPESIDGKIQNDDGEWVRMTPELAAKESAREILEEVERGWFDGELVRLMDAISARRFAVRTEEAVKMKASLSVGDKVEIVRISPKYLIGAIATVVELPTRGKKVLVRLEETRRSWPVGTEAKVPASCLEPHDGGPTDSDLNPAPSQNGRFSIRITTVGNPDFNQYAPITDPVTLNSDDWEGLIEQIEEYKSDWMIGGGNWTDPVLHKDGKPFAHMSFNLRCWKLGTGDYSTCDEISWETAAK